ncbi:hypothetical protein [Streptomyces sp. MMBL 11-1]|uniref:hypothetical protein n=1 Tax=Streptomyces sp. MMBL 11-1 TaxID=3026420 RepID=UPI002362FD95|nr:hypothetical protein [Streptomyces sp. MMBL 11-1]
MLRKLGVVAAAVALPLSLLTASTASADTDPAVYQACSTAYEFTTDVNGVDVTCEPMTFSGAWVWLPVLHPDPLPTHAALDPCSVPGLVSAKSGGGTLVCEAHFNGFFYWQRSI